MKIKFVCVAIVFVFIQGCGTFLTTTPYGENKLKTKPFLEQTYCKSVPSVYSGICFDVCYFVIAPPRLDVKDASLLATFMVDFSVSLAFDTLLLPYTVYKQANYGDVVIGESKEKS